MLTNVKPVLEKNSGCIEQIMSLGFLCDFARYKRVVKLDVLYIDFSKAHTRWKLVEGLAALGCGRVMLRAIKLIYRCAKNVLQSAVIDASIDVRQGAPSSSLLLTMDNTVILLTSREMCERKLSVVCQSCIESGMKINEKKTFFFFFCN